MNRPDYVKKMMIILNDKSKFQKLGPSSSHDRTSIAEDSLNDFLNNLKTNGDLRRSYMTLFVQLAGLARACTGCRRCTRLEFN